MTAFSGVPSPSEAVVRPGNAALTCDDAERSASWRRALADCRQSDMWIHRLS
ncbi:hypothetical protein ACFQ80_22215 [Isoptericola sp. NPDC056578]|uniref:hypothetical protein n=1 Tax=Isoptericola sp. NPDC056578 TaxID=3345870 RepID=UPI0036A00858